MSASFLDERVSAYLDDELPPSERATFEAELARSEALRAELEALRHAQQLVRAHGLVAAPAGVLDAVNSRIDSEPVELAWWRRLRRPLGVPAEAWLVAAAAAAVLTLTLPLPGARDGAPLTERAAAGRVAVPWAYTVFVDDPASLPALREALGPLDGALLDQASGAPVEAPRVPEGGAAYWVRVPDGRQAELDALLGQLGTVERTADGRVVPAGRVDVRVELRVPSAPVNFTPDVKPGDPPAVKPDDRVDLLQTDAPAKPVADEKAPPVKKAPQKK